EAPAPENPTWVDDVEPIVRGNCFHCHGAGNKSVNSAVFRWDFYDPNSQLSMIGDFSSLAIMSPGGNIGMWVTGQGKPLVTDIMPPPPATPLDDRDTQVLTAWYGPMGMGSHPRGMRSPNHKPTADWLVKGQSIVVSDEDREQVLGKITCGGTDTLIGSSGAT